MTRWSNHFEQVLRRHARFLEDGEPFEPDSSLAALGVDSLDIVELIISLEDEFGIEIPQELLVPEAFASPATIWRLLLGVDPLVATT